MFIRFIIMQYPLLFIFKRIWEIFSLFLCQNFCPSANCDLRPVSFKNVSCVYKPPIIKALAAINSNSWQLLSGNKQAN